MTISSPASILAIDDDNDLLETYKSILGKKFKLLVASNGKEALRTIQNQAISLVLLDIRMPEMDGLQVLAKIKELEPNLPVIMITASKDITSAVEAMKLGAYDYVIKPFEVKELTILIQKALEKSELVRENLSLRESLKEITSFFDLIGQTPQMKKLFETIESVAPTDSTVLIHGESGTGKELVARAIHKKSRRAHKPFITVNCAAIPENLFESDLFGHERGSFTGALERKLGKFELADGGTLFLDEIGCMPAPMQAKLLRVLEDRIIERVGSEKGIPIDVRLISATNIDFAKEIENGRFRHDLYYRLNVIPVNLSPLRERSTDIPLFVEYFINKYNKLLNKKVNSFSKEALSALVNYDWPGNVRELQNLIERVVVLAKGKTIELSDLPLQSGANPETCLKTSLEIFEKNIIAQALKESKGNLSLAAKSLKTPRTSLITRMRLLGLS